MVKCPLSPWRAADRSGSWAKVRWAQCGALGGGGWACGQPGAGSCGCALERLLHLSHPHLAPSRHPPALGCAAVQAGLRLPVRLGWAEGRAERRADPRRTLTCPALTRFAAHHPTPTHHTPHPHPTSTPTLHSCSMDMDALIIGACGVGGRAAGPCSEACCACGSTACGPAAARPPASYLSTMLLQRTAPTHPPTHPLQACPSQTNATRATRAGLERCEGAPACTLRRPGQPPA